MIIKLRASFSLIEIVVLISIIGLSFVGVSSLLRRTLQLEGLMKGDLVARGLAQECLELAEAMITQNISNGADFNRDLAFSSNLPGGACSPNNQAQTNYIKVDRSLMAFNNTPPNCARDIQLGSSDPGLAAESTRLKFDTTNYYNHSSGTATNYFRYVKATHGTSAALNAYLELSCYVTWQHRGRNYTYKNYRRIFDRS